MENKAKKTKIKTLAVKSATHRKLKRAAGSRKLFEYADELLVAGLEKEQAK